MKKLGIVLFIIGIVSLMTGVTLMFLSGQNLESEINALFAKNTCFYKIDEGFSIMCTSKKDNQNIIQIRKKGIVASDNTFDGNYYSLQYPVVIQNNKAFNNTEKISLSYDGVSFKFDSSVEVVEQVFGGEYFEEKKDFTIPDNMFQGISGIYQNNDKDYNVIYIFLKDEEYFAKGLIKSRDQSFDFNEKIIIEDDVSILQSDNVLLEFHDNVLSLLTKEGDDSLSYVDGNYQKINILKANDLIVELDNYLLLVPDVYGVTL